jgi:hypothetical protein
MTQLLDRHTALSVAEGVAEARVSRQRTIVSWFHLIAQASGGIHASDRTRRASMDRLHTCWQHLEQRGVALPEEAYVVLLDALLDSRCGLQSDDVWSRLDAATRVPRHRTPQRYALLLDALLGATGDVSKQVDAVVRRVLDMMVKDRLPVPDDTFARVCGVVEAAEAVKGVVWTRNTLERLRQLHQRPPPPVPPRRRPEPSVH